VPPKRRRGSAFNAKAARALKAREPKVVEDVKQALFLRGVRTSEAVVETLKNLYALKKPAAKMLSRRNPILPFEDSSSLDFLCDKNDCTLFALGSHNKKRPNNLVIGRLFDRHVLDLFEFGVEELQPLSRFSGRKKAIGAKPAMLFVGDAWEHDEDLAARKLVLLDFFRGYETKKLNLHGLDHCMVLTAAPGTPARIYVRTYSVALSRAEGTRLKAELRNMGPHLDLICRRTQRASNDLMKRAMKQPKEAKVTKVKNITRNALGDKVGRIHMKPQDLDNMQVKRMKALRSRKRTARSDDDDSGGSDEEDAGGDGAGAGAGAGGRRPASAGARGGAGGADEAGGARKAKRGRRGSA